MVSQTTVIFVCTGNTCRSPLAMILARRRWRGQVAVASAGLRAHDGEPATVAARAVARELGLDLDEHRSRPVDRRVLERSGWIIGMTRGHVAQLAHHVPLHGSLRLGLLGAPGADLRGGATPAAEEVNDPFGGELEHYRETAAQIERLLVPWTGVLIGAGKGTADAGSGTDAGSASDPGSEERDA